MENNDQVEIDLESYQAAVESMMASKDKEILSLRALVVQITKQKKTDNIVNPEVKGV